MLQVPPLNLPISIHAPRTGSDLDQDICDALEAISIHAPRTGSDVRRDKVAGQDVDFNPRSPHGERRFFPSGIHGARHFNPRSPHGERLGAGFGTPATSRFQSTLPARGATTRTPPSFATDLTFQSTLPARGATQPRHTVVLYMRISIHAPRTGSDGIYMDIKALIL